MDIATEIEKMQKAVGEFGLLPSATIDQEADELPGLRSFFNSAPNQSRGGRDRNTERLA